MDNNVKQGSKIDDSGDIERKEEVIQNPNDLNLNEVGDVSVSAAGIDGGGGEEEAAENVIPPPPPQQHSTGRRPFTELSQVEADWALACTLQEQERACMMLRMNNDESEYGSWEADSYLHDGDDDFEDPEESDEDIDDIYDGAEIDEEDAFVVHAHDADEDNNLAVEFDLDGFSSDDAYASALHDAEEREVAAQMFSRAGITDREVVIGAEEMEDHHGYTQDGWHDFDPDEFSFEELLALGDVAGTESRGLSADTISSLSSVKYDSGSDQHGSNDSCVICQMDYEDGETLTLLACKHSYHSECINKWLQINKVCPVCSTEVSAPKNS